jgi:hypothetical protein
MIVFRSFRISLSYLYWKKLVLALENEHRRYKIKKLRNTSNSSLIMVLKY